MILYAHINPSTKEVFYIGIGMNVKRAYCFIGRNNLWHKYVNKYGKPIVEIWINDLTPKDACLWEIFYIKLFGKKINGGMLVNMGDGGDKGALGNKQSDEARKKIGDIQRGKKRGPLSEEHKKQISIKNTGRKRTMSEETRKRMSISAKIRGFSEAHKQNISKSLKGKKRTPHSEETKKKMSDAQKGIPKKPRSSIFFN